MKDFLIFLCWSFCSAEVFLFSGWEEMGKTNSQKDDLNLTPWQDLYSQLWLDIRREGRLWKNHHLCVGFAPFQNIWLRPVCVRVCVFGCNYRLEKWCFFFFPLWTVRACKHVDLTTCGSMKPVNTSAGGSSDIIDPQTPGLGAQRRPRPLVQDDPCSLEPGEELHHCNYTQTHTLL